MRWVILDLEATCGIKSNGEPIRKGEIIEIGAVIYDDKQLVGRFSKFVRPQKDPKLTRFCKRLTSITQSDVDKADTFPQVWRDFYDTWLKGHDYVILSWGEYDRRQFVYDCDMYGMDKDWLKNRHASLKHLFTKILGGKRLYGMKSALEKLGIKLEGTHHRGIDDAINTAKIFMTKYDEYVPLIIKHIGR